MFNSKKLLIMKSILFYLKKSYPMIFLVFFSVGSLQSQMDKEAVTEMSVLHSFNDADLEWGGCPPFMPEGCNIAVLHGDPATKNADVLFKVNGKSKIPNHWHNSHERMVLLSGKMTVTYKGEQTNTMKVGDFAYGPARKPHTAECVSKDPCILYIGFGDPVDAFAIED